MLVAEPTAFTSAKSAAYLRLARGNGPCERNCDASLIRNGVTFLIQPDGSLTNMGRTGRHWPGMVPVGKPGEPKRPSFARSASIAAAAVSPAWMPPAFIGPSGMAANDDA